ncbi:MAG: hypothetical protein IPK50_02930 [Fibrobacterota bacterium]|nr:MAG: hypothetical protein IPK50_02930 [Fibrobacterota bacterium]
MRLQLLSSGLYLESEGFPAISSDGAWILSVSSPNSCCVDLGAELVRFRTDRPRSPDRLRIRWLELQRNMTAEDSIDQRRVISGAHKKAEDWLEGREWESMIPEKLLWSNFSMDSVLERPLRDGSRSFATWGLFRKSLPQVKVPCFDPDKPSRRCKGPASIHTVWSHPRHPWILVEYGHISGGSQLDDGPYWRVLRR